MLFAPNFVEVVLRTHLAMRGHAIVISDALDLPPAAAALDPLTQFDQLRAQAVYRNCLGSGACQSTTRAWFEKVHGYDERLVGWGYEDDDLLARAKRDGLIAVNIQHRTDMLHQWHETDRERMARAGQSAQFEARYRENIAISRGDPRTVRNEHGWGQGAATDAPTR